jgi:hypothetical protein
VPALIRAYGEYLFGRFAQSYPQFLTGVSCPLAFMERIERTIHAEVLKLYPDAELPHFEVEHRDDTTLVLIYRSPRPLADLAEGLIHSCIAHFRRQGRVEREPLPCPSGSAERFLITLVADQVECPTATRG